MVEIKNILQTLTFKQGSRHRHKIMSENSPCFSNPLDEEFEVNIFQKIIEPIQETEM